jgi:non-specific serine/threonine protein kinase/serine/threonine-protein kinase
MSLDERRVRALFDAALERPAPERAAFLKEACGGDVVLRARLEALLASHDRAASFLERPAFPVDAAVSEGGILGPYRLLRRLGEGGMGEVWLAEQTAPIRRNVALKLIKAGMDTRQVVARFDAERQALALMDHPTIARVFDAGETPRGLPYFAMEYVQGEPITAWCDRHRLPMLERLDLFIQVCEGVQHAHQKGVIHRDLKPSNVLIAEQDGRPVPKIIDFGVAKAIGRRLTERTMFTELGVLIGTPEYMSPEQAALMGADIDTRTDVYALGIILYELLVGVLPFDRADLREAGFDEILRRIREVDPPRPSTRIGAMGEGTTESARNRSTDPGRLMSLLKGDLDWITMRALEKDRARRYGSPSELASDVRRHLHHEPVAAGPPSAGYRAKKFVRRHRMGVSVALALALALVLGIAGTSAGMVRALRAERQAQREAKTARQVTAFLTDTFHVSDPGEARGNTVTARELLDNGVEKIQKDLGDEPEVQAQLLATLGNVYRNLGLPEKAVPLLEKALELRRRAHGPEDVQTLQSLYELGWAYWPFRRYLDAEKLLRQALEGQRRVLGKDAPDTLATQERLADLFGSQGRKQEAFELRNEVLEARRRLYGEKDLRTLEAMPALAQHLEEQGDLPGAEKMWREIVERDRSVLGADHRETLNVMKALARNCVGQKRFEEAEKLFREAYEVQRRVLGEGHRETLEFLRDMAHLYLAMDRKDEAETFYLEGLKTRRRLRRAEDLSTILYTNDLAGFYAGQGRLSEAEKVYLEAIRELQGTEGVEHPDTLNAMSGIGNLNALCLMVGLASLYAKESRHEKAEQLFLESLEKMRRVFGENHEYTVETTYLMGCAQALRPDRPKALEWLRKAVALGFKEGNRLAHNPDCKSLQGDADFEAIVADARKNSSK